jgi:protein gp37
VEGHPYEQGFDLRLVPEKLVEPLRWKTPKMVFVNSMSDLFHKDVPEDYVEAVCRVMERANWHTYQVLTKRSSRMRDMFQTRLQFAANLPNTWWGVSFEDRAHGLVRIKHLRQAPAAVRFLSIEPLLEDLGEINLEGIHWVIVGGESGPGARPMQKEWVLSLRDQCDRAQVPFFFKQWGGVRKSKADPDHLHHLRAVRGEDNAVRGLGVVGGVVPAVPVSDGLLGAASLLEPCAEALQELRRGGAHTGDRSVCGGMHTGPPRFDRLSSPTSNPIRSDGLVGTAYILAECVFLR